MWYRGQTGRRRTISSPIDPGEQKARKVAEGGVVDGVMLAGCGAEGAGVVDGVMLAGCGAEGAVVGGVVLAG